MATNQLLHVVSSADRARREAQGPRKGVIMTQTPSAPTEREGLALSDNIEIITRFEYAFRAADQADDRRALRSGPGQPQSSA